MILDILYNKQLQRFKKIKAVEGYSLWRNASASEIACLEKAELKGMRVLDVGCGTGRLAPIVASFGGIYHGIDQSAPMISAAKALHPGLHFTQRDALQKTLEKYDVIILMHNTLGAFFPYQRRISLISNLCDMLSPNGRLVFSCHAVNGPFSSSSISLLDWPFRIFRIKTGKGYAIQKYHGELITMFRATPNFIGRELSMFGFKIAGEWPDNSRDPIDWTYYLAHLSSEP